MYLGTQEYVVQNVIFCSSKITNFVQISNFRPNLVQLLKDIPIILGIRSFNPTVKALHGNANFTECERI